MQLVSYIIIRQIAQQLTATGVPQWEHAIQFLTALHAIDWTNKPVVSHPLATGVIVYTAASRKNAPAPAGTKWLIRVSSATAVGIAHKTVPVLMG